MQTQVGANLGLILTVAFYNLFQKWHIMRPLIDLAFPISAFPNGNGGHT